MIHDEFIKSLLAKFDHLVLDETEEEKEFLLSFEELTKLVRIELTHPLAIRHFLYHRNQRIKDSSLNYKTNPASPMNQLCQSLAAHLDIELCENDHPQTSKGVTWQSLLSKNENENALFKAIKSGNTPDFFEIACIISLYNLEHHTAYVAQLDRKISPLHYAVLHEQYYIVEKIIQLLDDHYLDALNRESLFFHFCTTQYSSLEDHIKLAELLIKPCPRDILNSRIEASLYKRIVEGVFYVTPLDYALQFGHYEFAPYLILKGATITNFALLPDANNPHAPAIAEALSERTDLSNAHLQQLSLYKERITGKTSTSLFFSYNLLGTSQPHNKVVKFKMD